MTFSGNTSAKLEMLHGARVSPIAHDHPILARPLRPIERLVRLFDEAVRSMRGIAA